MFSQYFGQYLLNNRILTGAQLADCMAYEKAVHVKLGVLAISAGILTAAQVEDIHALQRRQDKKFGEIAIEQGFLTLTQLENLLESQKSKQISLSQAVLDRGYLTLAELEQALSAYKKDSGLSEEEWKLLQSGDIDSMMTIFLDFADAGGSAKIYSEYVSLVVRSIVRFLGEVPLLGPSEPLMVPADAWLVTQCISGDIDLYTGLYMDEAMLVQIACSYSQEKICSLNDLAKDSVAEFLNLINGIFCVNASDKGTELDLKPQSIEQNAACAAYTAAYAVPLVLSFGTVYLIIGTAMQK